MKTAEMKQKLHDYIDTAEEKKLRAIYTILESDMEAGYNWWEDKELLAELDRREAELLSGAVQGASWEDVKNRALKSIEKSK